MISFWEKRSFLQCDVVIIGAGITGLSAAACLAENNPNLHVSVLEKGLLPSGASTKNAGFACFGSISELQQDISTLGEDGMTALVEKRIRGLQKTRKRLGEKNIDLKIKGGYELIPSSKDKTMDSIPRINSLLHSLFHQDIYRLADEKIDSFGLGKTRHLIENKFEGQLDTGKLMASLWQYCSSLGVRVFTGCNVEAVEDMGEVVEIECESLTFKAAKVGICTNAFATSLVHVPLDVIPGRGMVMCISPEKINISGTYHYQEGYYYFRDFYDKIIFGGGRNLALNEETTTEFGINDGIRQKLLEDLKTIVIPNQKFKVEMEWSGIMAFGADKTPIIQKTSKNISIGVRLGGMGVAIGSLVGEEVAHLLLD